MPIYTKGGDKGTSQFGNSLRVRKDDARLEALGTLDELNCAIGLASALLKKKDATLEQIQSDLLLCGAALAGTVNGDDAVKKIEEKTTELEKNIDGMEARLAPLKNFILPGGTKGASMLHLCRAAARKAERRIITANFGVIADRMLPYFNRLSSYFFVRARYENFENGESDKIWKKE